MVILGLIIAILVVGIIVSFAVKKKKAKQEVSNNEPEERLPKLKFDD